MSGIRGLNGRLGMGAKTPEQDNGVIIGAGYIGSQTRSILSSNDFLGIAINFFFSPGIFTSSGISAFICPSSPFLLLENYIL